MERLAKRRSFHRVLVCLLGLGATLRLWAYLRFEDEAPYDLAFAVRVGALDGRHPRAGRIALQRLRAALVPGGRLYVDGGEPLRVVRLEE